MERILFPLFFLFLVLTPFVDGKEETSTKLLASPVMNWHDDGITIADRISEAIRAFYVVPASSESYLRNISTNCVDQFRLAQSTLETLINNCTNPKCIGANSWIRDVLDSQGRRPPGVAHANKYWIGSYHQCTGVSNEKFKAKYCKALVRTRALGGHIHVGICAPGACSSLDMHTAVSKYIANKNFSIHCSEQSSLLNDHSALIAIGFLIALALLVLAATLLECLLLRRYTCQYPTEEAGEILLTGAHFSDRGGSVRIFAYFSLLSNSIDFYRKSSLGSRDGTTDFLDGMKSLACLSIIAHHSISYAWAFGHLENGGYVFGQSNFLTGNLMGWQFSVDIFFLLGGFLMSYNWLAVSVPEDRTSVCAWMKSHLRRYLRLTPPLALVIWYNSELHYYTVDGPFRPEANHACKNVWWANLLYINNFFNLNSCMATTWYLAVDFQLRLLSPLILIPLASRPKFAYALGTIWITVDAVARGVAYGANNLSPFTGHLPGYSHGSPTDYYGNPLFRAGPYIIGLLLGHYILSLKHANRVHGTLIKSITFGFYPAFMLMGLVPYIGYMSPWANGLYCGVSRVYIALYGAWIIYACFTGNADTLKRILSCTPLRSFGQLAYCCYLIHYPVYFYMFNSSSAPLHFESNMTWLSLTVICLALTIPFSLILHLAVPWRFPYRSWIRISDRKRRVWMRIRIRYCELILIQIQYR